MDLQRLVEEADLDNLLDFVVCLDEKDCLPQVYVLASQLVALTAAASLLFRIIEPGRFGYSSSESEYLKDIPTKVSPRNSNRVWKKNKIASVNNHRVSSTTLCQAHLVLSIPTIKTRYRLILLIEVTTDNINTWEQESSWNQAFG